MAKKPASNPKQIISDYMRRMSKKGQAARRAKLSPERRREIAQTAALMRWERYRRQHQAVPEAENRGEEGQAGRG